MMKPSVSTTLLSLFTASALSLSKRTCRTFEPQGKDGDKGYITHGKQIRVSSASECTRDPPDESASGGCEYDRYKMGITVNATVNVSVSDLSSVVEAVREAADPETVARVNLNETFTMPYTVPQSSIPYNSAGYYTFQPKQRCWSGLLSDCADDDEDLDGTVAQVCGYVLLTKGKMESSTEYDGKSAFVEADKTEDNEDRPWPEYESNATKVREDLDDREQDEEDNSEEDSEEDSGATKLTSMSTVFTCLVWPSVAALFLYM
ncbi:hypothetical protein F66182_7112 [Fusarium sp. NRRL 66182]|nr:hypothetical protein F66182_7112 [Fusarium sp. NRRL 66182]